MTALVSISAPLDVLISMAPCLYGTGTTQTHGAWDKGYQRKNVGSMRALSRMRVVPSILGEVSSPNPISRLSY